MQVKANANNGDSQMSLKKRGVHGGSLRATPEKVQDAVHGVAKDPLEAEECERLRAKIGDLEVKLEWSRKMLCAAEDIIIEQRAAMVKESPAERVQDRSRLLSLSLALNLGSLLAACVYVSWQLQRHFKA